MRYIITFFLSLIAFFTLHYFQVNNIFVIVLVITFILIAVLFPLVYTIFHETDMKKIERFLLKNKKDPNFYMTYALANKLDKEVEELTEVLLHKFKKPSRQASYRVVKALYFKDIEEAKLYINQMAPVQYRHYYQTVILIEEGNFTAAHDRIEKMPENWMKYALLAEIERKRDNLTEAEDHARRAQSLVKGLQAYLLQKTYEREFGF
ncbi:hypothetical protein F9U64_00055 [Gracilibacillus oryzae]|uniref:Uncharacterized protein n=1 Tax=Gracilibacillus oryzae TaxID=1672701 RepID=A0A7C8L255_9BACI|nr:hypothetical protein [Gracilibacillus oryzae]KAB8139463.1 hypothetical protein F9U64_00055 [Gracilibacillus oryzae]